MVTGADGDTDAVMVMLAHEFRRIRPALLRHGRSSGPLVRSKRRRVPERVASALEVVHDSVVALGVPESDRYQGLLSVGPRRCRPGG